MSSNLSRMPAAVNPNRLGSFLCGPCGARIATVLLERTGKRIAIERAPPNRGELAILQVLPGLGVSRGLPVAVDSSAGGFREHKCSTQNARSFSAANFTRKVRPT